MDTKNKEWRTRCGKEIEKESRVNEEIKILA